MVMGLDHLPLFHHFSWVRTEQEMLKKVKSWGHKKDRNWEQLVINEFSKPFQGTDFVHGYSFREVLAPFSISLECNSFSPKGKPKFCRLTETELKNLIQLEKMSFWKSLIS
jgi:hypothetical protein